MSALGEAGDFARRLSTDLADRYEIVRKHRRGGMATVYLAVDRKHDRQVALKVLGAELAAGIGAERFLREIEIAAHLTHPHILPLLDSGLVAGLPYYVMPFVEEESLRERLARVGPLPVDEALRIAHDVAEALAHAHGNDVVHRDIKPGNVMLTGESAVVTDFGIAVAMDEAAEHLTRTGHSVGTAGYMSPEQASGDHDVDGRTDQYSLACVLFEMLTGDPPYTGRNARAILGRQLSQPVPDVSALRDSVPEGLDDVLRRALARAPADRYPTMWDFADAIENMAHRTAIGAAPTPFRTRRTVWAVTAAALMLVAASWLLPGLGRRGADALPEARADTTRYAIFPFDYTADADFDFAEPLLHDALARWDDISVVDAFEVGDAVQRTGQSALRVAAAAEVAREERAGRFIMGRVSPLGDSLRVLAVLYEVEPDGEVRTGSSEAIWVPGNLDGAEAKFGELAAVLLFRGNPPDDARTGVGTRSLQALKAFQYGEQAVRTWELARADSGFLRATLHDPAYARAHLWLALVRAWAEVAPSKWTLPTQQAVLHVDRLPKRDAAMAEAIWLQAEGRTGEACSNWDALTDSYANDFAVWFGLAHCLSRDSIVVPDAGSQSGWSFRSSRHRALEAYEEAFKKLPSILEDIHSESHRSIRRIFLEASGTTLRRGRAEWPDTTRFRAYPGWQGDTLAHVPYLRSQGLSLQDATTKQAMLQLREMWLEWAATAVAATPASARARASLAYAMMLAGEPAALDTLLGAQKFARTEDERFDLTRSEIWMRLALALPDDPAQLERARVLADSLLLHATDALASHPHAAAGIAALLGRAHEAARYARQMPADPHSALPHRAQADANALLVFAALGGPIDSIARLEQEVEGAIRRLTDASARRGERGRWLVRPATLAVPDYRFRTDIAFDWVVSAQRSLADGDTVAVRESLARAEVQKQTQLPFVRTFDTQFAEMRLLIGLGDLAGAAAWVDPSLAVLAEVDLDNLSRAEGVGPLVRIAAHRAEVAAGLGDHGEARRWAGAVLTLRVESDPFLQPLIDRMRELSD